MEQVGLITSGVQLWSKNIVASRSDGDPEEKGSNILNCRVAFCSTLAVFVLEASTGSVRHILAGYEGIISALCWSPYDLNMLATASEDGSLVLWALDEERRECVVKLRQAPTCLAWFPSPDTPKCLAVATARGSIILWNADKRSYSMLLRSELPANLKETEQKKWKESHRATVINCNSKGEVACGFRGSRVVLMSVETRAFSASGDVVKDVPSTRRMCEFHFPKLGAKKSVSKSGEENKKGTGFGFVVPDMSVVDLQWDPCSPDYLLAAYGGYPEICMWDCSGEGKPVIAQTFKLPAKMGGALSLEWQTWAPGNFMSISEKGCGLMHVWNVSQKEPIDRLQLCRNGTSAAAFRSWGSLCVVALDNGAVMAYNARRKLCMMTTKASHRETVFDVKFSPEDPDKLASCSFDGRIKIWDTRHGVNECVKTLRHKDRPILYSISWSPYIKQTRAGKKRKLLASATYSGFINVWDTAGTGNGELLSSVKVHAQPIYRVQWNKHDPELIASSSADKTLAICQIDLDSGSLKVKSKLIHPDQCFGCAWSPHYPRSDGLGQQEVQDAATARLRLPLIAAACQDGCVYVWDTETVSKRFLLKGHDTKIFNVAWNPIRRGVLASGSDDKKVIVWTLPVNGPGGYSRSSKLETVHSDMVFVGHTRNVRALLWSSELEYILISGSWDHTIKIWDTALGVLLATVVDHHADVYGLDVHPERPFRVVSSSRDTTIRFWQLTKPQAIDRVSLELISFICFGSDRHGRIPRFSTVQAALKGCVGRRVLDEMRLLVAKDPALETRTKVECLVLLLRFFRANTSGLEDLWDMIGALNSKHKLDMKRGGRSKHGNSKDKTIYDCKELVQAHVNDNVINSRKFCSTEESSTMYVQALCKVGEFRTACQYLRDNGSWDKALAIAPAVSLEYWRSLNEEHAALQRNTNPEGAVHRLLAAGRSVLAINMYCERKEFDDALLLAQVSLDSAANKRANRSTVTFPDGSDNSFEQLEQLKREEEQRSALVAMRTRERDILAKERAKVFLERGEATQAACCLLGSGDPNAAVAALLLAGDETLALVVATLFAKLANGSVGDFVLKAFAAKCERAGSVELALQVLRRTRDASNEACLLSCRFNFSKQVRFALGLRQTEQYLKQGWEAEARGEDLVKVLKFLCASHNVGAQTRAVCAGVERLCMMLKASTWDIPRMVNILHVIQTVDLPAVLPESSSNEKYLVLALSSFIGALQAMWQQCDEIVSPLFNSVYEVMVMRPRLGFPFPKLQVTCLEVKYLIKRAARTGSPEVRGMLLTKAKGIVQAVLKRPQPESKMRDGGSAATSEPVSNANNDESGHREELEALILKITDMSALVPPEHVVATAKTANRPLHTISVASHALFNGNTRYGKRSMFDGKFIRGQSIAFAPGKAQYISMAQAILWAKFNPFSPANSGAKLFNSFGSEDVINANNENDSVASGPVPMMPAATGVQAIVNPSTKVMSISHSAGSAEDSAPKSKTSMKKDERHHVCYTR